MYGTFVGNLNPFILTLGLNIFEKNLSGIVKNGRGITFTLGQEKIFRLMAVRGACSLTYSLQVCLLHQEKR